MRRSCLVADSFVYTDSLKANPGKVNDLLVVRGLIYRSYVFIFALPHPPCRVPLDKMVLQDHLEIR